LNGNVKQVNETNSFSFGRSDTTLFNEDGIPIETRIGAEKGPSAIIKYDIIDDTPLKIAVIRNERWAKTVYLWDSLGHIVRSMDYPGHLYSGDHSMDKPFSGRNYKYDLKGNLIEIDIKSVEPERLDTIRKNYDTNSNLIEMIDRERPSVNSTYKYFSFDQENNWTKRLIIRKYINRIIVDTIKRKITYY